MSRRYYRDLLAQAEHLAGKEPRRPKQASLRRAVSAAYYAFFHFLVDEACRNILGTSHHRRNLRYVLTRAFSHTTMKNASMTFAGGALPAGLSATLVAVTVPSDLRDIAKAFIKIQQERHRADYDLANPFTKGEVSDLIGMVRDAVGLWQNVKTQDAARLYLLALLVWDQLKGK